MFRVVLTFLMTFFFSLVLNGKVIEKNIDSLLNIYYSADSDIEKLKALNNVSVDVLMQDRKKAISLAREGILLINSGDQEPKEIATAIYNLGYLLRYAGKNDSSILLLTNALNLFKNLKDTGNMAYAYSQLGANYHVKGESTKALHYFDTTTNYFALVKDTLALIKSLGILGSLQSSNGLHAKSLQTGQSALNLALTTTDSSSIAREYAIIAGIYSKLDNFELSKQLYFKALHLNDIIGNKLNQFYVYDNLGTIYQVEQNYDSLIWAAEKALELADTNSRPKHYPSVLIKLSHAYTILGKDDLALKYMENGFKFCKEKNLINKLVDYYRLYGFYYRNKNNFKESEKYYSAGLKIVDSVGLFYQKENYYTSLAYVYEELGDYESAYTFERLLNEHKDSIYKLDRIKAISEAEALFANEKRDMEFSLLKKETEIKDRKAAKQKAFFFGLLGLILLLALIAFFAFRSYKLKQRLRIEKFRNKVAADLHDDVGSTLSSIAMYSEVIKNKTSKLLPEITPMLENMTNSSSQLMEAMSDIVWTINPKNNTFKNLIFRIREFASQLCEANEIKFSFIQEVNIDDLKLNMDESQNIYLVMKEAINNALKYAKSTEIELKIYKEGKNLLFIVKDNGIGFDANIPNIGNGMNTMSERMKDLGGKLEVTSTPSGTTIKGIL